MIASRRSLLALALAAGALLACAGPSALPAVSAIERRPELPPLVPDVADYTAARLAAAALVAHGDEGRRNVERALRSLGSLDRALAASDEPTTGLVPAARDLANASLGDLRAYRRATEELLHDGLDPALEERLEQFRDEGLLRLASKRIWEARQIQFANAFNALAEPAGRSMMNLSMAPYRFAQALLAYGIQLYKTDALPLQRRQALAYWKDYLLRYPDDPLAEDLKERIASAQARWNESRRDKMMGTATRALSQGDARLALVYADRALRYLPEDEDASDVRDEAEQRLLRTREQRRRSVSAPEADGAHVVPAAARDLALATWLGPSELEAASRALLESDRDGPLADEARFSLATALLESGREVASWNKLEKVAAEPERNMARHARALLHDDYTHPYGAFRSARGLGRSQRIRFALLGPWSKGPPERGLPEWMEWPLGVPSLAEVGVGLPLRVLQIPWLDAVTADAAAATAARRYLAGRPDGEHAGELRGWLRRYEARRGNWLGVLALAEEDERSDPEDLAKLTGKAAAQSLDLAQHERDRGLRLAMLRRVAREFPETPAAHAAGLQVREETFQATPQRIRLSRDFLVENPQIAGIAGLALRPELLDGDASNGELHPDGVTFVGSNYIELSFVAPGGDRDDPPEKRMEALEPDHLGRVVALLEETTFRNALLDRDAEVAPDARRDVYFEQARLGRADIVDPRPDASADFTYRSMRERYGMVRGRESILPFSLVLQGSFDDLSLGAFPRINKPHETPDAIFYK